MKKHITSIFAFAMLYLSCAAQDTLVFENFDVDPTLTQSAFPSGTTNDLMWTNFDEDGLVAANSRPGNWYWSEGFSIQDSMDRVFISSSWLDGFAFGNRNWLMTPAFNIADNTGMLSWESATYQFPLYCDGYVVLVSTTDNNESSFTDTLFQQGGYISGSGNNLANYVFSPGVLHGSGNTSGPYFEFDGDSMRFLGVLEPHSVSLAAYTGMTIYVAFLHDSDDDYFISVDDILITGTDGGVGIIENNTELSLSIYPNPSSDFVHLEYFMTATSPVDIIVYDISGKKVAEYLTGTHIRGEYKYTLDTGSFETGNYLVELRTGYGIKSGFFIVE